MSMDPAVKISHKVGCRMRQIWHWKYGTGNKAFSQGLHVPAEMQCCLHRARDIVQHNAGANNGQSLRKSYPGQQRCVTFTS
jgi:hypothetical protein